MLGSFKTRLLIVIVIVTLAGLAMQSNNGSREVVEPVIAYVMKDYQIETKKRLAEFLLLKHRENSVGRFDLSTLFFFGRFFRFLLRFRFRFLFLIRFCFR